MNYKEGKRRKKHKRSQRKGPEKEWKKIKNNKFGMKNESNYFKKAVKEFKRKKEKHWERKINKWFREKNENEIENIC